jgi:hypothetical protein
MLKIAANIIAPSLTYIFNLSLSTGIFIDDWKNTRNIGNYRPISILPRRKKFFDKFINILM